MNYLFASLETGTSIDFIPVGLAYVAAALRQTGRNVSSFFSPNHKNPTEALIQKVQDENIDVLCFGELSANFPILRYTINCIKKKHPHVKIIVGGGIITAEPEFVAQHLALDYGCVGYGEETICEFAECLETEGDFSIIKGLLYKDETGNIIINPHRPEPESIDDISFPALELFGFEGRTHQGLPITGSRSCIYNCTFCFHPSGQRYRQRSLDSIFAEIDYWRSKYEIRQITLADELFGNNSERVYEFCRRIKKLGISFNLNLRVDIVTDDLMKELSESGCTLVCYGIESLCQNVLDSMRKKITVGQIENALKITRKYNLPIQASIIFGDSAETYEMALESLSWWVKNIQYGLSLNYITAYPGSALYKYGVENGLIKDRLEFLEQRCPITNLSAMSDIEFIKLRRMVDLMRNMMGEPVTNQRIEETDDGDILFYADCPNCGSSNYINYSNVVNNAFNNFGVYLDFCDQCGSKMRIAQQYKDHLLENPYFENFDYEGKKIAVWGVSLKASFRLATVKKMRKAVTVVIDRDYYNIKDEFWGFMVQSPEILPTVAFDILYIGSRDARKKILSMAKIILGADFDKKEIMMID